jgi:hypothetical protein
MNYHEKNRNPINLFAELSARLQCSYANLETFCAIFGGKEDDAMSSGKHQMDKLWGEYKGDIAKWINYLDFGNRKALWDYYVNDTNTYGEIPIKDYLHLYFGADS